MADPGRPVEVTLVIAARPETIFRYFTDPARFARWMGQGAVLDPEPGGRLWVGYPTGQVASMIREIKPAGEVIREMVADAVRALTTGLDDRVTIGRPVPAGS